MELIVKAGNEHTTFGLKRGLPYTQFLQIEVVKLKQYGVLQNILEKYATKPNCNSQNADGESADSIRFEKVVLPFAIFAIGSVFAIIIITFEKCCLRKKKSCKDCKGQLISKCPLGVFKSPTKPTKFFPEFLPMSLKRGQIKNIKEIYTAN